MRSFALITSLLILIASSLQGATGLEDGSPVNEPTTGPHTAAASFAGVVFTASNNVFTGATQTMPKLVALEVQGTNVVESGVAGTTAGLFSIADRNAGRGWNNLAVSNGVLYLNDVLEGSSNFVNQAGDTMSGTLNLGANPVTNATTISATEFIGDGSKLTGVGGGGNPLDARAATNLVDLTGYGFVFSNGPQDWLELKYVGGAQWYKIYHTNVVVTNISNVGP